MMEKKEKNFKTAFFFVPARGQGLCIFHFPFGSANYVVSHGVRFPIVRGYNYEKTQN